LEAHNHHPALSAHFQAGQPASQGASKLPKACLCVAQAGLEEGAGLGGIHLWDVHQRQQVLAHPRGRHLRAGKQTDFDVDSNDIEVLATVGVFKQAHGCLASRQTPVPTRPAARQAAHPPTQWLPTWERFE
jgi:hypothetical protein